MPEKDDSSNKKRTSKKRTTKQKPKTDKIQDKIAEAIQVNLEDFARRKQLSQKTMSSLNSYIEEHLSCFVLMGYNKEGEPVSLINARSPKDSDSLGTLLHKFMSKYADPPQNPPNVL